MDEIFDNLLEKLTRKARRQKTAIPYNDLEYTELLIEGIQTLYIDIGYENEYYSEFNEKTYEFNVTPTISRQEYMVNAAMLAFYNQVQQDVNTIVGYSTNSLTITNADKPYANISNEVEILNKRQVELFYKIEAENEEGVTSGRRGE